ncbi:MAG: hypothetical protein ED859_16200 [Desulfuromonadales bacterium]|nr:MAG: hypothetical protein ED859_16200 [Desulfuromonadales bacterium]
MRQITEYLVVGMALGASLLLGSVAQAGDSAVSSVHTNMADISDCGQTLTGDELATMTGQSGVVPIDQVNAQLSVITPTTEVNGNTNNSGPTGPNFIADSAFLNLNGIATVIQNSGNQVNITNSMIINILMN